jgi:polyphosphate kinase
VYDEQAKKLILDVMEMQWRDRAKARLLDEEQTNKLVPRGNRRKLRSQEQIHELVENWSQNFVVDSAKDGEAPAE